MAEQTKQRKTVEIPATIAVRELADRLSISPIELLKALIANGIMAAISESIDYETAAIVAEDLGFDLVLEGTAAKAAAKPAAPAAPAPVEPEAPAEAGPPGVPWYLADEAPDKLETRSPVVTIMGHVDHGKTSLLDKIRNTRVAAGESGGITQHIGAYTASRNGQAVTFIDTPGHEAFTAMRARGAQATDIAVIVVAADDGVMPQTREAVDHAKAAGVPIVVAVNKSDLPEAKPDRIYEQMAELGVVPDSWGGDVFFVQTSAATGAGIDELLDAILFTAEEYPPKGNPKRLARGTVLEGKVDPSRGVTATLLVQSGTLNRGDTIVVDDDFSRVRAMFDHTGREVKTAGPSTPVEVMGLNKVPAAGTRFEIVKDQRTARNRIEDYQSTHARVYANVDRPLTLEELFAQAAAGDVKALNLIIKTDVQGTVQPVVETLEKLSGEVKVDILHATAGDISESDINLAAASGAVVIGFRSVPDGRARRMAAAKNVEIREYAVIYKLAEDVEQMLHGMVDPVFEDKVIGTAEIRQVFNITKVGRIAGSYVTSGVVRRNAKARLIRDGEVISESSISSLKRFAEDAREVREGFECGIGLDDGSVLQVGDVIEACVRERVR